MIKGFAALDANKVIRLCEKGLLVEQQKYDNYKSKWINDYIKTYKPTLLDRIMRVTRLPEEIEGFAVEAFEHKDDGHFGFCQKRFALDVKKAELTSILNLASAAMNDLVYLNPDAVNFITKYDVKD